MEYTITKEKIDGRTFFRTFRKDTKINVVFEPIQQAEYAVIVFSENGKKMDNLEEPEFLDALNKILFEFDKQQKLEYDFMIF